MLHMLSKCTCATSGAMSKRRILVQNSSLYQTCPAACCSVEHRQLLLPFVQQRSFPLGHLHVCSLQNSNRNDWELCTAFAWSVVLNKVGFFADKSHQLRRLAQFEYICFVFSVRKSRSYSGLIIFVAHVKEFIIQELTM